MDEDPNKYDIVKETQRLAEKALNLIEQAVKTAAAYNELGLLPDLLKAHEAIVQCTLDIADRR